MFIAGSVAVSSVGNPTVANGVVPFALVGARHPPRILRRGLAQGSTSYIPTSSSPRIRPRYQPITPPQPAHRFLLATALACRNRDASSSIAAFHCCRGSWVGGGEWHHAGAVHPRDPKMFFSFVGGGLPRREDYVVFGGKRNISQSRYRTG